MFFIQSIQTQVFESLTGFVELSQCSVLIGSIKPLLDFRKNKIRTLYKMILLTKHTHFPSIPAKNNECKCNRWQWLFRAGIYFFPIYKMQKSPINFEIDLLSQLCAGVYILPFNIWRNIVLEALLCIDLCDRGYMSPSIHICIISRTNHFQWNIRIKLLTTVDLVRLETSSSIRTLFICLTIFHVR